MVISAGDMKYSVGFKEPTTTKNNEGGKGITYATSFTARAAIERDKQFRTQEAGATVLLNTDVVTIRYATERKDIRMDWLLNYGGVDHNIHAVDYSEVGWIKIQAKADSTGAIVASPSGTGESGGAGGGDSAETDLTNLSYNQVTGLLTWDGDAGDDLTEVSISDNFLGYFLDGTIFSNEGGGYNVGNLLQGSTTLPVPYFRKGVTAKVMWGKNIVSGVYSGGTETFDITRLAQHPFYLKDTGGEDSEERDFPMDVINVDGDNLGEAASAEEYITMWNGDAANTAWGQILSYSRNALPSSDRRYLFIVEPNPAINDWVGFFLASFIP